MKCVKCNSDVREGFTTYVEDVGKCCIVVRKVPCTTCVTCGEVYYSGRVMATLEKLIGVLENAMTEVAVVSFPEEVGVVNTFPDKKLSSGQAATWSRRIRASIGER